MDLKPIETQYNGYKFRSRLEARWAVYFDTMDIQYEYEKEGYDLGSVGNYLPDFWLPQVEMWAEVKPMEFNQDERIKAKTLARATGYPVLKLIGLPDYVTYSAWLPHLQETDYLLSNYHGYLLNEKRFYSNTEFRGKPKNVMQVGVYELDGESIKKGVVAAKSARFEYLPNYNYTGYRKYNIYTEPPESPEAKKMREKMDEERRLRARQSEEARLRSQEESKREKKSVVKSVIVRDKITVKKIIKTEIDVCRQITEEGYQISQTAVNQILSNENPTGLIEYILNNIDESVFVIECEHIDVEGFNKTLC